MDAVCDTLSWDDESGHGDQPAVARQPSKLARPTLEAQADF